MKKITAHSREYNKGFSMIELIIVVAIIATLVAILAPQYLKYVEKSRQSVDQNTIKEIYKIAQAAISDPDGGSVVGETLTLTIDATTGIILLIDSETAPAGILTEVQDTIGASEVLISAAGKGLGTLQLTVDATRCVVWTVGGTIGDMTF